MYHFNELLFRNLPSLLGMTQIGLSLKVFGNRHTYIQRLGLMDRLLVEDLVKVCNSLHISISHFITLSPDLTYIRDRSIYVTDDSSFIPVRFDKQKLTRMYGKRSLSGGMTRNAVAAEIGVSASMFNNWINQEECTMKLSVMIRMCNRFGVNMGEFISDPNLPLPLNDTVSEVPTPAARRAMEELSELRKAVTEYQRSVAGLKRENERLRLGMRGHRTSEDLLCAETMQPVREWKFNRRLLDSLPELFGTSRKEMLRSIGMVNPSVGYNGGNITVAHLVSLCNRFHISSHHFFVRNDDGTVHTRDWYVNEPFMPVAFHAARVADTFGRESLTGLSLGEVLERLGCSQTKFSGWRREKGSTMRVDDLAALCNALCVTPSCFITDSNRTPETYGVTTAEFFLEENRLLRQRIIRLNEELSCLKRRNPKSADKRVAHTPKK